MFRQLASTIVMGISISTAVISTAAVAGDRFMGQGSTFALPVYQEWAKLYYAATGNEVTYNGGGSGKGISAITQRNGAFGGSDEPLKNADLAKRKLYQWPGTVGSIVLAYNLDGVKDHELKLSSEAVAGIFAGTITKWNDPVITKDNPNLKLPNAEITPVVRSDASGTTFNFTTYLSDASKMWKDKFGIAKSINWAPKNVNPASGNPMVAKTIKQIPNSIGYIEYAYKLSTGLPAATLQTAEGGWAAPTEKAFAKAAVNANFTIDQNFYDVLAYGKGKGSYPIVAATFVLVPSDNPAEVKKVTEFFNWAFTTPEAIKSSAKQGYLPLPKPTVELIQKYWAEKGISPASK